MKQTQTDGSRPSQPEQRFSLKSLQTGELLILRSVIERVSHAAVLRAMQRHTRADWGDVSESEWKANDIAFQIGNDVISRYRDGDNPAFYIVTTGSRKSTAVFLEEEFDQLKGVFRAQ